MSSKGRLPFFKLPLAQGCGAIILQYHIPASAKVWSSVPRSCLSREGCLFSSCLWSKGVEQSCHGTILQQPLSCGHQLQAPDKAFQHRPSRIKLPSVQGSGVMTMLYQISS
ncbi:hypothetical protein F4604DRAFT_1687556 [Suillus subluteus]|nr:hypothetical protein F4604DRAFT_1687556 [Suillus subluteus]